MTLKKEDPKPFQPNDRELKVGAMLAEGKIGKEIGAMMGMIEPDVKYIIQRMRRGLGARNSAHLVAILIRNNMIKYNEDEKVHDIHWN